LGHKLCGKVRLKKVHDQAVGHITVVELELNHGDVTNRPIMKIF
jgi:hypothetical protein